METGQKNTLGNTGMNSDGAVGMIHMQENAVLQGVFFPSICISSSQYFEHSDNLHLFCYYYSGRQTHQMDCTCHFPHFTNTILGAPG